MSLVSVFMIPMIWKTILVSRFNKRTTQCFKFKDHHTEAVALRSFQLVLLRSSEYVMYIGIKNYIATTKDEYNLTTEFYANTITSFR